MNVNRSTIGICILAPVAYFGVLTPVFIIFGIYPLTVYYDFQTLDQYVLWWVLALNVIYLSVFWVFVMRFIPRSSTLSVPAPWVLLGASAAVVLLLNFENWGMARHEVKEMADPVRSLATAVVLTYLGAVVLSVQDRMKLGYSVLILLFVIALSWERESILYLLFPVLLRLGSKRLGVFPLVLLGAAGFIFILTYKMLITYFISSVGVTVGAFSLDEFWIYASRSFFGDNMHKSAIELFYFAGISPDYLNFSYFLPLQFGRVFDPGFLTNGQLATLYYTGGRTGTGFSAVLEGWLNFGPLGFFVLPFLVVAALRKGCLLHSAFWVIALLTFAVKLQRSDLWPAVIGHLLGPLLAAGAGFLIAQLLSARRGKGRVVLKPLRRSPKIGM